MALGNLLFRMVRQPRLRELLWKLAYETFPRILPDADWWFMNYGYEPSAAERKEFGTLDESQFQWRSRAMYHYLAARAKPEAKELLEVGSGRGGGLRYVADTLKPKRAVGLDFAASAVKFCHKNHRASSATYLEGNAMALPFADAEFDILLNVESCHAYLDQAQFLREVARVLRPGGALYLVDVRADWNWDLLYQWTADAGLELHEKADITSNVLRAIELDEPVKNALIKKRVPFWLRGVFKEFAGNVGSQLYERLKNGEIQYRRMVAVKAA
jgi:ubiquinone/menaquinone biosynthesis C-methylase UbiE